MIQNEVTEIKKIMTKNDCCIHGLAGCYVDANKEMHILEQGKFLVLQEEEQHKYFDLIKKGLSGRIGKNLLNLVFRTENGVAVPNRDTLMQVLNSELKDPQVLQAYFEKIRDSYAYVDNYYIMLGVWCLRCTGKDRGRNRDGGCIRCRVQVQPDITLSAQAIEGRSDV